MISMSSPPSTLSSSRRSPDATCPKSEISRPDTSARVSNSTTSTPNAWPELSDRPRPAQSRKVRVGTIRSKVVVALGPMQLLLTTGPRKTTSKPRTWPDRPTSALRDPIPPQGHNALPPGGSGAERPPTYVLLSGRGIRAHLRSREFQSDQRLRESDGRGHSIDDRDSATIDDRLFEIRHSPAPEDDDFSTVTLNRLGGRVRNGFNGAPGMALEIKNRHS